MNDQPESVKVLSTRAFWIIKGSLIFLLLVIAIGSAYFYGEYRSNKRYLQDRAEFIERYKMIQYEMAGITFCYEPRGGLIREAVYKGNNLYRVKP